MTTVRRWAPLAAFVALATLSVLANRWGWQQHTSAAVSAEDRISPLTGHGRAMDMYVPWSNVLAPLLAATGAAGVAYLLRRAYATPWFLGAALIPLFVSGGASAHGWLRPGTGLDAYASGAGVAHGPLDLTSYGAGPAWVLWAGTALTLAIVLVPALLTRPGTAAARRRPALLRVLPYAAMAGLGAFSLLGLIDATQSGGDQLTIMTLGGFGAVALVLAGAVLVRDAALRHLALAGAALALIAVATLNPGAELSTKLIVASLAFVAVGVAEMAVRRPRRRRQGVPLAEAL